MMNPKRSIFYLLALILAVGLAGCSDGAFGQRPSWGYNGQQGSQFGGDIIVPDYKCVNLLNYLKFEYIDDSNYVPAPVPGADDLVPGDVTHTESVDGPVGFKASEANQVIMKGSFVPIPVDGEVATESNSNSKKDMIDCIEEQLDIIEASGSEYYWGSRTYLLTREKGNKKPNKDYVQIEEFKGCKHVQSANCVLINYAY